MKRGKRLDRIRRKRRVRSKIGKSTGRPRLTVFRSNKYISAQLLDDSAGHTLAAASTQQKALQESLDGKFSGVAAAKLVGKTMAELAQSKGIKKIRFDRSGYKYHGRVKALADAAREAGLEF